MVRIDVVGKKRPDIVGVDENRAGIELVENSARDSVAALRGGHWQVIH